MGNERVKSALGRPTKTVGPNETHVRLHLLQDETNRAPFSFLISNLPWFWLGVVLVMDVWRRRVYWVVDFKKEKFERV